MSEPTSTRRRWFQFGLGRLLGSPALLAVSLVAARVPYAVALSEGRVIPLEREAPMLAVISGACFFASIGVLFRRGGEATIIGMIVGLAIGLMFNH